MAKLTVQYDPHYLRIDAVDRVRCAIAVGATGKVSDSPRGVALGVALDISSSMTGAAIDTAKATLIQLMEYIGRDCLLSVVAFNHQVHCITPGFIRCDDDAAMAELKAKIKGIRAEGSTDTGAAVMTLVDQFDGERAAANQLVLLADGVSNVGIRDVDKLYELIRDKVFSAAIAINTFAIGDKFDATFLAKLARNSAGGLFNNIVQPEDIKEKMGQYVGSLRGITARRCTLTFSSPPGVRIVGVEAGGVKCCITEYKKVALELGALYVDTTRLVLLTLSVRAMTAEECRGNECNICSIQAALDGAVISTNEVMLERRKEGEVLWNTSLVTKATLTFMLSRAMDDALEYCKLGDRKAALDRLDDVRKAANDVKDAWLKASILAEIIAAEGLLHDYTAMMVKSASHTVNRGGIYETHYEVSPF